MHLNRPKLGGAVVHSFADLDQKKINQEWKTQKMNSIIFTHTAAQQQSTAKPEKHVYARKIMKCRINRVREGEKHCESK